MSYFISPDSPISWGNLNDKILQAANSYNDITLSLLEFKNVLNYYQIVIPNTVLFFKVIGNSQLTFNASIKAENNRTSQLSVTIKSLNLSEGDNTPIIDIAKDNKNNLLLFEDINTLENLSIAENTVNSGICILENTSLSLSGVNNSTENVLNVTAGFYGAGIGGGNSINAGNITIFGDNTTINSTGGFGSSGIGGSFGYMMAGNSGTIKICNNSNVTAFGGPSGCGIGGGSCFYNSGGNLDNLIICDSANVIAHGGYASAGIGGGFGLADTGGSIINLNISNYATVYAYGGELGCGIGGGYGGYGGSSGNINITDSSSVYAYGGDTAGGISGGTSGNLYGIGGHGGNITISGNSFVVANGGIDGSGIGGGAGDIGGNGGTITVIGSAKISTNTFIGYYKNTSNATLNICGGIINSNDLYLSDINLCGGAVVIEDKDFIPTLEVDYFLSVKLLYPNGSFYTSPVYLKTENDPSYRYYVTPNDKGELNFYASDGSYYFETLPLPYIYKTTTFTSPYKYGEQIVLTIPIYIPKVTRGINIFLY